ncbi:MAG: carbohydrate ABC transporter permease [Lachnospiraceae bacterium]|nr:carbohydrate ABC transporter permease [Lachnospiraceae bacterium]
MKAYRKKRIKEKYTKDLIGMQILATVLAILFAFPILMIINFSFKTKAELYMDPPLSLPSAFRIDNFINAIEKLHLNTAFFNSFFYTIISVGIMALICTITAWAIARGKNKFFRFSLVYFIIGILVPAQALMLPIYQIWNYFGMINTRVGLILLYIATGMSFGIFLQTNFMSTVPVELEEAARIDGCNVYQTFFKVVLPLVRSSMATMIIIQTFNIWNEFMLTNLMVSRENLRTVTLALKLLFSDFAKDYATAMAGIILSSIPIVILFICLQKQFIKGMTVGAVKG